MAERAKPPAEAGCRRPKRAHAAWRRGRAPFSLALLATLSALDCAAPASSQAGRPGARNTLFIVVDNLRPALGAYGDAVARTPRIDALASLPGAVLFSRSFCQEAWCSPSRSSFLTGRRPQTTQVFNFRDSFRVTETGARGAGFSWVTMPGYFNRSGVYATSSGKLWHPGFPANNDFPASWSDQPLFQQKFDCADTPPFPAPPPDGVDAVNMSCEYVSNSSDAAAAELPVFSNGDEECASATIGRLRQWRRRPDGERPPFFAAAGLQGPRLPWSFPTEAGEQFSPADMRLPKHPRSPASPSEGAEWFRPTEIAWYVDVVAAGGVTHDHPLPDEFQRRARRAYYAAIANADTQVGRLLDELIALGVDSDTVVVFTADHGQNLGESNTWSMMSLMETSLRVPLVIRPAPSDARFHRGGRVPPASVYPHVVELVDLFPTLASLAGLPDPPASYALEGDNLVPGMLSGGVAKAVDAAFGQITRCMACPEAYAVKATERAGCDADAADRGRFYVPCSQTNRSRFDLMGMSVRTAEWRYSVFCRWNGTALWPDLADCGWRELYDHRNDTTLYDVDDNGEYANVLNVTANAAVRAQLDALIRRRFARPRG